MVVSRCGLKTPQILFWAPANKHSHHYLNIKTYTIAYVQMIGIFHHNNDGHRTKTINVYYPAMQSQTFRQFIFISNSFRFSKNLLASNNFNVKCREICKQNLKCLLYFDDWNLEFLAFRFYIQYNYLSFNINIKGG